MACDVSSVPLSLTTMAGRQPRSSTMQFSSRLTRRPDSDVSTTKPRHSRVKSSTSGEPLRSTTANTRNRRLLDSALDTKSSDQRWFAASGIDVGERVPRAHFRPPRLRTPSFSSR